jgi:hypothetical protein
MQTHFTTPSAKVKGVAERRACRRQKRGRAASPEVARPYLIGDD